MATSRPSPHHNPASSVGTEPLEGLAEQASLLASGSASSLALVERALARAEQSRSTVNAFWSLRSDAARAEAEAADRRLAAGERAPLLGVPVAIKDEFDIVGEPTQYGCAGQWADAKSDSEVVRRLRGAGAIIVGKTTAAELGQWPVTANDTCGVTRNPWSLDHTPGGSSGGSAAAVAAGIVAAAVGADGAGSIRIPSAWSHLVGIKPQRGRISPWPLRDAWQGLAVAGPLARSVADAALLLDVLSGHRDGDRFRVNPPAEPFAAAAQREPGRLTIGISRKFPFNAAPSKRDEEVLASLDRMAAVFRSLGHAVVDAEPHYAPYSGLTFLSRGMVGLGAWVDKAPDRSLIDPRIRAMSRLAGVLGGPVLRGAHAAEPRLRRQVGRVFQTVDVLVTPTTAVRPLAADALRGLSGSKTNALITGACPYAWPWNVLGWPGVNIPAGFTTDGLPVGVQLLGPEASEERLISLAAQVERAEQWQKVWPAFATELAAATA